jgi:sulfur-oxidizing protein SoxA
LRVRRFSAAALVLCGAAAVVNAQTPTATDGRRSGFQDMSAATQALQSSDSQNPAFLWVKGGEDSFSRQCKGCHETASMRGVAARYPAFDSTAARPLTLGGRIQQCRQQHAKLDALPPEHDELLGLEAFVALQSRGLPIAPPQDTRLDQARSRGQQLWQQRLGQLGLSCAQCHDHNAGGRLAGSVIPQGHATGYPLYRLEWQGLGSLQRRMRNCMTGVRAAAFAYDSPEFTALELHLKQRAAGMPMDAPAVRP